MIYAFALGLSLLILVIILLPFFFGKGGQLQAAASINSLERLEAIKTSILKRYLEDERAFEEKRLAKLVWDQRKSYLSNRYIDAARRYDFLQSLLKEQASKGGAGS
jgi:hypothetical protein